MVIAISWLIMAKEFQLLRWSFPTALGVYYIGHLSMQFIPALFLLQDPQLPASSKYLWACVLTAILIPVSGIIGSFLYNNSAVSADQVRWSRFNNMSEARAAKQFVVILGIVASLILVSFIRHSSSAPVLHLFQQTHETRELNQLRRYVLDESIPGAYQYLYGFTQVCLMPFLFLVAFTLWRHLRSVRFRVFLLYCMGVAMVYNSYASRKTPIAMMFVLAFIAYWINRDPSSVRGHRPLQFRRVFVLTFTLLCAVGYPILVFKFKAFGESKTVWEILVHGVLTRIFTKPAFNTYMAFEVFPDREAFTAMMDINKLATLFGKEFVPLSHVIAFYKGQEWFVNAPPASVGNFYALAGWLGVVVGTILATVILKAFQGALASCQRWTVMHTVIYTFLLYGAFRINFANFHTVFMTEVFVPICFFWMFWNALLKRASRRDSVMLDRMGAVQCPVES